MEIKILNVFYGSDALPYKDQERATHFPIAGNGFQGASNTTEIRFYFKDLGTLSTTWVAVSKLPNGKIGSKVLQTYLDSDLNEYYAKLELSSYYFQYKGDVFISLQGYEGGVNYEYNSEEEIYIIHGTPTIRATGSIKLAVNYATQFIGSGEEENADMQSILALLGLKLNIADGIVAYTGEITPSQYEEGQIFYNANTKEVYKLVSGTLVLQGRLSDENYTSEEKTKLASVENGAEVNVIDGVNINGNQVVPQNKKINLSFKTINSQSILGSGNIDIQGGGDYTAGNGIDIEGNEISVDTDVIATKQFVNSSISTETATFRGTYNIVTDLGLTISATEEQIASAIATKLASLSITADDNDYVFVAYPNATVSTQFDKYDRYKYDGESWEYEYTLNNSSFTAEQWAAINSGITSGILSNLATKGEVGNKLDLSFGGLVEYDNTSTYSVGDKVSYQSKLYRCTTAVTTAEDFDSAKWTEITLNNYVDLTSDQTITGAKTLDYNNKLNFNLNAAGTTTAQIKGYSGRLQFDYNNSPVFAYISDSVYPLTSVDLGLSSYKWKDLYLAGSLIFGDSGHKILVQDSGLRFEAGAANTFYFKGSIRPSANASQNLGGSLYKWNNLYLSGSLSDGTNSVTVADIAGGTFNVINASDIVDNTLNADQLAIVKNGKPTLINGTFRGANNPIILNGGGNNPFKCLVSFNNGTYSGITYWDINSSGFVNTRNNYLKFGTNSVQIETDNGGNISTSIGGKALPNYPSNTGTFTLKCVDGVLTWVAD